MHIDRYRAQRRFLDYVAAYDATNPRIALKVAHTLRVARLAERIAASTEPGNPALGPDDVSLAWLCGLLHDIGRFEQVRRFDTFNDAISVPHATLGAEILFQDAPPLARDFCQDESEDALIKDVVATHGDFRLPKDLDARTRVFAHIIRDADKLDILQVNVCCPIEDIYGVTEDELCSATLTPEVVERFYAHSTCPRAIRRTPADIFVSHLCFVFELVWPESRRIVCEQGHVDSMLSRAFSDPETQRTFEGMAAHLKGVMKGW